MSELTTPSEIARETLRLLASRRLAPNPENYRRHYQEVAGLPDDAPEAERVLQQLARDMSARAPAERASKLLVKASSEKNWPALRGALMELLPKPRPPGPSSPPLAESVLELVRLWDTRHSGLTTARKREQLERVLKSSGGDTQLLQDRLAGLVRAWAENPVAFGDDGSTSLPAASAAAGPAQAAARAGGTPEAAHAGDGEDPAVQLRDLLARTLEFAVVSMLGDTPELAAEATELAGAAREAGSAERLKRLSARLRQFWFKLEIRGADGSELRQGLLRVLRLLIENTHELVSDDAWLSGQMTVLQDIITKPLTRRSLADAETRLKQVLYKQSSLRSSLVDAKSALKQLITSFIDRLGDLSQSTDGYQAQLGQYAQKIRQTDDIGQLHQVLDDLLRDTRAAQVDTARVRDELVQARRTVESAEQRVRALEAELEKVSELVLEDQLTGVLNRRGLEDAFEREASRAERIGVPLCAGMLDIDNFKQLNDTYGHQTGDQALRHLVKVIREAMRPSDVLARFGGEEFVLLLPETRPDEALAILVRLQRNLTAAFFLHQNERVLITFSAGVAERLPEEAMNPLLDRVDKALYQAKRSGKNRVCTA